MKIIDISHTLSEKTPSYPGDKSLALDLVRTRNVNGYHSYYLQSGLHTGTHVDMPMHLLDDSRTAAQFDPSLFIGRGVLLDVRGFSEIPMLPEYENRVFEGDIVLLYTGWDEHFGGAVYFAEHPVISEALCDFLISRRVKMLGLDTPSPDRAPYTLHKRLLDAGVFLMENTTNLCALEGVSDFEVIALPLKIEAEASLVRAVCAVKDKA